MAVSQALLGGMAAQHKFALVERLTADVLCAAADGALPLARAASVVADALELLGIAEMQIDVKKGLPPPDEDGLHEGASQVRCSVVSVASAEALLQRSG